jgi:hypothetical protein
MDRGESVNAPRATGGWDGPFRIDPGEGFKIEIAKNSTDAFEVKPLPRGWGNATKGKYGTCLYFGPAGERCTRPALEGGFCQRHRLGATTPAASAVTPKRVVAILAALAAFWPVLADLVREFIRWIHAH